MEWAWIGFGVNLLSIRGINFTNNPSVNHPLMHTVRAGRLDWLVTVGLVGLQQKYHKKETNSKSNKSKTFSQYLTTRSSIFLATK